MTTAITIRRATAEDIPDVVRLLRRCVAEMHRAGIDQWDEVYPTEAVLRADAHAHTLYLGASDEGVVGSLVVNEYQNPEYAHVPWTTSGTRIAVVHRLMVDPSRQRTGIARELMQFVEHHASELRYTALRLDAFTGNPGALRLYAGLGYHDVGCVTFRKGVFRCFEKTLETPSGQRPSFAGGVVSPSL